MCTVCVCVCVCVCARGVCVCTVSACARYVCLWVGGCARCDGLESDHRCVLVQFDVSVSRPPPVHSLVRNIRGIDRVAFKRDLEAELCSLVDPSADQYNATLRSVLDKHAPNAK